MKDFDIEKLSSKDYIIIKEAATNNLKSINVAIPRDQITVITGLSGSGKSSLAFDTIYKESRRMYVESLSAYARNLFGKIETPKVKQIFGLSPAIAIQQKITTGNSKSTVATITDIYEYLKIFFSRIGETYSPISGRIVKKDSPESIYDDIIFTMESEKILLLYKLVYSGTSLLEKLNKELAKGFFRIFVNNESREIEEFIKSEDLNNFTGDVYILVDRYIIKKDDEALRIKIIDSIQAAVYEGKGYCYIFSLESQEYKKYANKFELDGITFEEPTTPSFFSYNSEYGSCNNCKGTGKVFGIDKNKIIPDKNLSLHRGVVSPWQESVMQKWQEDFINKSRGKNFPVHKSYIDLSDEEKKLLWEGDKNNDIKGINDFFDYLKKNLTSFKSSVIISNYSGLLECGKCFGTKIREDAHYVKVGGKSIIDIMQMTILEVSKYFENLLLSEYQNKIGSRLLLEIKNRISFLMKVGLNYLSLMREAPTLSGGEFQRIMLANALGNVLVGTLYILDEPTIGLHPRDTEILIDIITSLKNIGNTIIIVEHDEDIMRSAERIIDIGPESGIKGGEVVFNGTWQELKNFKNSYTAKYLNGILKIETPEKRKEAKGIISIEKCCAHNLKNFDIKIPLCVLTVITGVSGSGKSTLTKDIIFPAIANEIGDYASIKNYNSKNHGDIKFDHKFVKKIEYINQSSLSRSSISTPISYIGVYDNIRALFSRTSLAKEKKIDAGHFSYNTKSGVCLECEGAGTTTVDMQFMADVSMVCEACQGMRFSEEILEIKYKNKNIYEVLEMTVEEAIDFFISSKPIINKLELLKSVGLGYLRLGQSTNTMSGGEAQRLKLSLYLKSNILPTVLIFDEPTTGLHTHDVAILLKALDSLVEKGHTVILVEHNLEVIKCADYIIDLGPESGSNGGELLFSGTPEDLLKSNNSYTAKYLKAKL